MEDVRGEAVGQTGEEKGHIPALGPDLEILGSGKLKSALVSSGQLWAVQPSIQTSLGPGDKPHGASIPELLQADKSTKLLRTKAWA